MGLELFKSGLRKSYLGSTKRAVSEHSVVINKNSSMYFHSIEDKQKFEQEYNKFRQLSRILTKSTMNDVYFSLIGETLQYPKSATNAFIVSDRVHEVNGDRIAVIWYHSYSYVTFESLIHANLKETDSLFNLGLDSPRVGVTLRGNKSSYTPYSEYRVSGFRASSIED